MSDWREWRVCDMERELQKLTPREAYDALLSILAQVRPMLSEQLDRAEQTATQSATSGENISSGPKGEIPDSSNAI